ncbi:MAG: ABC-type transport system involved in Fe-S cluster assembly fused permease/ATPase subunit [Enterobacterales bacterium]|jgi:ABC-type transport system involved in Fe-S cluster assembly fused permease/ATPase subunit
MRSQGQIEDSNPSFNWTLIKNLLPYLGEFKGRVIFALVFMVLAKLSTIVLPFFLKEVVDLLGDSITTEPSKLAQYSPAWLLTPLALVLAYGFFRFINVFFGEIRDTLFSKVTERAMRRVGLKIFRHLHALDIDFHLNRRTGGLSRDIERGTNGISFLMRFMVFNIVPTLIEISMVIVILLTGYGIEFGLVTFTSVVIYITYSVVATNWRNKYIRAANEADSNSSSRAIDSLLNYETVKYFTNEEYESKRYDKGLIEWENAKQKNRRSLLVLNTGQAVIISSAITVMMYMAVFKVQSGDITVGDFVLINAFMMQLFMPLNFLGFVYREIKTALVNIEKMFSLLSRKGQVTDNEDSKPLDFKLGEIKFEAVNFSYHKERKIINDLNFTIHSGQKFAIVGTSGSGKSTLVKLLFRFYDPTYGKILIDGQDISKVSQESLRKNIGIVPQDTVLFNDSIFENIRYGLPEASDDEVREAIELAHLKEFIERLPEKENTRVGERGLKLSGGEKQRVAIARTILKRPPIMVFDEATSSLDSQSEQSVLTALNEISKGVTTVVIAHRLSTIIDADVILVLEQGELLEQGNHQQLLEKKGKYADLWLAQQKDRNLTK